jgi:S-DNA-T family DNA segregation ATPase FtsK/SpoIIIE
MDATAMRIEEVCRDLYRPVTVFDIERGPQATTYYISAERRILASGKPGKLTRLSTLGRYAEDIGAALGVAGVQVTVNGHAAIIVPKKRSEIIQLESITPPTGFIPIALGVGLENQTVSVDLGGNDPHLMVAGATGSGKSVALHNAIGQLAGRFSPDELGFVFIDVKRVEMASYRYMPHNLARGKAIDTAEKAVEAVSALVTETESRYQKMQRQGARHIAQMQMKRIILVVDELADLLLYDRGLRKEIEEALVRLAQIGRAAGVHVIVATQRPSADVVTGILKANIPTRIAFKVATGVDSRVILDQSGAERLQGAGDGLLLKEGQLTRFQGVLAKPQEYERPSFFKRIFGGG